MFIHEAPYLGSVNHASQLRTAACKLQNYAELNFMAGGTYGVDVLAPFWADQTALMAQTSGYPTDGKFLGMGVRDIRKECYMVQSAIRMSGNVADKAALTDFFKFFSDKAKSLVTGPVKVNTITVKLSASTGAVGTAGVKATATVLPADAADKSVTWKSSNVDLAIIDQAGNLKLIKAGTVTITATAEDGSGVSGYARFVITAPAGKNGVE